MGLQLGCTVPSPVLAVRFSQRDEAFACWQALVEAGVYTNLMMPPASPDGSSLLRVSVSAAHTAEQVEQIIAAFAEVVAPVQQRLAASSAARSEEHTSELQSLMRNSYAVFCLQKKKHPKSENR